MLHQETNDQGVNYRGGEIYLPKFIRYRLEKDLLNRLLENSQCLRIEFLKV